MGSPPRVRGKAWPSSAGSRRTGITPACAGKRMCEQDAANEKRDHPRVCGEKLRLIRSAAWLPGSPPRVRGKASSHPSFFVEIGITPACAGKRRSQSCQCWCRRDHPRVCGEKRLRAALSVPHTGSPPRVRGKAGSISTAVPSKGITPACAGKRLKRSHSIGHFSCILCLFHSVLHRASVSGGSRAGPCAPPCLPAQNAVPV